MSDLFISYASEDRDYVIPLVQELENQGWTVWWDRKIEIGTSFDKQIETALDAALCILVVWSEHSVGSDWVRAEAAEGLERNILVPVLLDAVKPPLLFRQKQAISLVEWKKSDGKSGSLRSLIPSIRSILDQYQESNLPVSTQSSWVLGKTENRGVESKLANSTFAALSLGLSYFENLFIYTSEFRGKSTHALNIEQLEALVAEEGLNGYLYPEMTLVENVVEITLHVYKGDQYERFARKVDARDFHPLFVGECLLDAAEILQGNEPAQADLMLTYLKERNTDSLHYYWLSFQYELDNDHDKAKDVCLEAISHDEEFLQAYRGLAIAYQHLGRQLESKEAISKAIKASEKESQRNAIMARALYYAIYSEDYGKAVREFESVLQLSPLDEAALNNLAVCYFYLLDFQRAKELSIRDLALYPMKTLGKQNLAFYSFYAQDFGHADKAAEEVIEDNPAYLNSWIIRALIRAKKGELEEAESLYLRAMGDSDRTRSIMLQGLADLALAKKDLTLAKELLLSGIEVDQRLENFEYLARKLIMRAEVEFSRANLDVGIGLVEAAMENSISTATLGSIAVLFALFQVAPLSKTEMLLKQKTNTHGRAYAKMAQGITECHFGNLGAGIQLVNEAVDIMDLWLIRFSRALVQKSAGLVLEAADDISVCRARSGEALSAALDEQPTFRYFIAAEEF